MGFMKELNIPREKINVKWSMYLGHPIGASGEILVTLLNALEKEHSERVSQPFVRWWWSSYCNRTTIRFLKHLY